MIGNVLKPDGTVHIEQQVGNMRYDLTTGQMDTVVPGAGPVSIRSCRLRNRTYAYTHTYAVAHTHTRTMEHMHVGISTHMHIAAHAPIGLQPRWAPCFRPFSVSGV